METNKNEPLSFEPGKVSYKFSPLKYVVIFLVVISIGILSFYFINDYINEKRIASTKVAQEKIKNLLKHINKFGLPIQFRLRYLF